MAFGVKDVLGPLGGIFDIAAAFARRDADFTALSANMAELEKSAKMEEANAVASLGRGEAAASRARMAGTQMVGQQRLGYAASGIDTSSGTAASVAASTQAYADADAMMLRANAVAEALGHKTTAGRYRTQAELAKLQRDNLDTELGLSVAKSAIGMAAGVAAGFA